jgi:hypothetical protein
MAKREHRSWCCRAAAPSGRIRRVSIKASPKPALLPTGSPGIDRRDQSKVRTAFARRVPAMWIEGIAIVPSVFTLSLHRGVNNMHVLYPSLCIVVAIVLMKEQTWTFFIHGRFCGFCLYSFWHARFLSFRCFSVSSRSSPVPRIGQKRQRRAASASRSLDAGLGTHKPTVAHSRLSPMERLRQ